MVVDLGQLGIDVVEEPVVLGMHGGGVGLVVDAVQHRLHGRPHRLRGDAHQVERVVGAAALPGRAGEVRRDRLDESAVGVGGD